MSQIRIDLIDHMGSDLSTVNSARVSFDKTSSFDEKWEYTDSDELQSLLSQGYTIADEDIDTCQSLARKLTTADAKLIHYLASHRHMTPFRHNQIQLRCHAPIFLARQLGKHQAGMSWNEVSRRYVDTTPEFYTPDEWRGRPGGSIKQGSIELTDMGTCNRADDRYLRAIERTLDCYEGLLRDGVAPEMARMVLPQSMMTSWYWTGNLLAFAHVYRERIAPGAQLEAQLFAQQLDTIIRPLYPVSWSALVDQDSV
jgi:thymidylate synthase (FAD)